MSKTLFVSVCLDQNIQKFLDYTVPEELQPYVKVGMRVEVPLRGKTVKATICKIQETSQILHAKSILKILSMKEELSPALWKLAQWLSQYYATSLQKVLKCFIPPHIRKETKPKVKHFISLKKSHEESLKACQDLRSTAPSQATVLEYLLNIPKGAFLSDLTFQKMQKSTIDALIRKQWLTSQKVATHDEFLLEEEYFQTTPKKLNEEQFKALEQITISLQQKKYAAHLIYGITGSGKTEVYLQAIAKALSLNQSVILLIPEIALTSQTIDRFRSRFSEKIAILNHKRSQGEKNASWEELKNGQINIVIGARSAIFAPCKNLGLIIIDEEHDSSYKQTDDMPCYQARDVAVMRAYLEHCTIILGSATPSIESRYNASIGKYQLHTLKNRATNAHLPKVDIIDMKKAFEINRGFTHFSQELLEAIKERIAVGEQTLLLLNKRGYYRMQLCTFCKKTAKCPHCDLSLTYHKEDHLLKCHFCLYKTDLLHQCPDCGTKDFLTFKGFGTEHVEKSLHALLPEVRTLRMDRDTTQKKNAHEDLFKQFRSHKADVLIGTQMIAKGFHFPSVTLVGILNVDSSLHIPDFRSSESTFQLLTQVAGRAGRSELAGKVILQTFLPEHPIIQWAAKHDYDAFYDQEIMERQTFFYPPFCHLIKLRFSSKEEGEAKHLAETAHAYLRKISSETIQIFDVSPSGRTKTKDYFHYQFLIKCLKLSTVYPHLQTLPIQNMKIDIDPLSTFF